MEIGGYDTVVKTSDSKGLAKRIMDFIDWPKAVIEFIDEGDFFWYKTEEDKALWDEDGLIPAAENTMIYFLFDEEELTIVTDKELTDQIHEFLKNI